MSRYGGARVGKIVLVSSVAPYLLQATNNPNGVKRSVFDTMIENLSKDRPEFLATFGKQFYGAGLLNFSTSQELLDWTMVVAMMASPKATKDCVRAFSETDFRPEVSAIRVPTLVIHGDSDDTVPIEATGREAARMIPGARLEVYNGSPHGLFVTDKDRLNGDLTSFVLERATTRVARDQGVRPSP
jgi:non-heme chloroperoxidase